MKLKEARRGLEVQAFLMLERAPGSKEFLVSVHLQADGQFIGKTSLGTAAEGQEILLSLRWDKQWGVLQYFRSSHFRRLARAVCLFLRIRDGEELRVDVGCEDVSSVSDSVLVVCSGQEGRLESAIRSSLR